MTLAHLGYRVRWMIEDGRIFELIIRSLVLGAVVYAIIAILVVAAPESSPLEDLGFGVKLAISGGLGLNGGILTIPPKDSIQEYKRG